MQLLIIDRTVKRPIGVLLDVLIKEESFIFPNEFLILHCEVDFKVPIIRCRPFLNTRYALVNMEKGAVEI